MSNWERYALGKVLKLQGGYAFNSSEFSGSYGVPLIRISNVTSKGLDYSDIVHLNPEYLSSHWAFSAEEGDVLIAMSGATTGKNCRVTKDDLPALINQRVGRFKIGDARKVDKAFLYYIVNTEEFQNYILRDAIGGAQPNISSGQIESIVIDFPPFPEQQKIAKILRTVDGQIEKTEAIIAKYKAIKQGLMQDLFTRGIDVATGKLRPRYQDAPELYKPSPLGMIPKEWDVQKLNELTNLIIDGTHFTPNYKERGVPFLRVTDIQQDEIDKKRIKFISEEEHQLLTKRCKPEIDDILLSKNGTIGITKVVDWDWEFSVFVSLCLIKPKHKLILSNFLSNQISSFVVFEQIRRRSKQGTVTNLHLEEIREFDILLPHDKLEQEKITERVLLIASTIRNEESNLQKLKQIKRGLMSDLLSGKVRVQVDEEAVC